MNTFTLTLLLTILTTTSPILNSISGTVSRSLPGLCQDIGISDDGSTMVCSQFSLKAIEIFTSTESGF